MAVRAPSDKHFRRARVAPVRRSLWRRWGRAAAIALLALVGLTYGASRLAAIAATSPALTVKQISIRGNVRLTQAEVHALLEGLPGTSLVRLDLDYWRHQLLSSPWIADAELRRVFPNAVTVVVTERVAAGIARAADAMYVIDEAASIIEPFGPKHAPIDVPIVDGLIAARSHPPHVDQARARLAARFFTAVRLYPELAARVSQVDVTDAHDAVVVLKDDTVRVHLGDAQLVERLRSYTELAAYLRDRMHDIDYVDLRYGDRVYVKPFGRGSSAGEAHVRGSALVRPSGESSDRTLIARAAAAQPFPPSADGAGVRPDGWHRRTQDSRSGPHGGPRG